MLPVHVVVRRIMSNISGCTGPIFAVFSPYERALRAHDGSVSYFPVYQETLPWQPKMLPKWRQTDTTCILCMFARWQHGFILLRLTTNATISCKILLKIGPVVLAENRSTNGTCMHVNATGISYYRRCSRCSIKYLTLPNSSQLRHCTWARSLVRHCLFNIYFFGYGYV